MTTTTTRIEDLRRIETREEARRLAEHAYAALARFLRQLTPEDWERPTVCSPWDVADVVRHLVGEAAGNASFGEGVRQLMYGLRNQRAHQGSMLDAMNHGQVIGLRHLGPDQLIDQLERTAPAAVRGRMRLPALVGKLPVPMQAKGSTPPGLPPLTFGELNRVIYTRDTLVHRIDVARATGRSPRLEAGSDARIIQDVVVEWARRHRQPFELRLGGDGGGTYLQGKGGPVIELGADDFCWILSGRVDPEPGAPGADLLATKVIF